MQLLHLCIALMLLLLSAASPTIDYCLISVSPNCQFMDAPASTTINVAFHCFAVPDI